MHAEWRRLFVMSSPAYILRARASRVIGLAMTWRTRTSSRRDFTWGAAHDDTNGRRRVGADRQRGGGTEDRLAVLELGPEAIRALLPQLHREPAVCLRAGVARGVQRNTCLIERRDENACCRPAVFPGHHARD